MQIVRTVKKTNKKSIYINEYIIVFLLYYINEMLKEHRKKLKLKHLTKLTN